MLIIAPHNTNFSKTSSRLLHAAKDAIEMQEQFTSFASKCTFKGPWGATGKIFKFDRCANAFDCCTKLRADMNHVTNTKKVEQWIQWESDGDERALDNRTFRTHRTFVGLAVETEQEFQRLQSDGYDNVVLTNRSFAPDVQVQLVPKRHLK